MTYESFALLLIAVIAVAAGIASLRWFLSSGAKAQRKLNCVADIMDEWQASRPAPLTIDQTGRVIDVAALRKAGAL